MNWFKKHKILTGIIAFFLLVGIVSAAGGGTDTSTSTNSNSTPASSETTETAETKPAEKKEPEVPAEYKSALAKADTYANTQHMSEKALFEQLTSEFGEQFSKEAAQYAIDNVETDYNANALAKAKTYQETQNMSPAAIRDQLVSEYGEQFTATQADYAIKNLNN